MKCLKCRYKNKPGTVYCTQCGFRLKAVGKKYLETRQKASKRVVLVNVKAHKRRVLKKRR